MYDRIQHINSESPLKKILISLFHKNEKLTIFDIGGCEGEDSIRYSRIFPLSSIYIFEPLPDNQILIYENLSKYKIKNVKLYTNALSDIIGFQDFHVSSGHPITESENNDWNFGNKSSSLLPPDEPMKIFSWLKFDTVIKVKTETLNNFAQSNNLESIDFIHMDVQGSELKVLKGAQPFLKKIKAIWLEVSDISLYKDQPLRIDVEKFMIENGFKLIKTELKNGFGDQLYINRNYFKELSFFFFNKYIRITS